MAQTVDYSHIYVDLSLAFATKCRRVLDPCAIDAFRKVIEETVIATLEANEAEYEIEQQIHLFLSFAEVGRKVNRLAPAGTLASRDHVLEAVGETVKETKKRLEKAKKMGKEPAWVFCVRYEECNVTPCGSAVARLAEAQAARAPR